MCTLTLEVVKFSYSQYRKFSDGKLSLEGEFCSNSRIQSSHLYGRTVYLGYPLFYFVLI